MDIQQSERFEKQQSDIREALKRLLRCLGKHSVPFYSPRYSAHMISDQNLPAILGYIATMFYNPNNVAFEASPYTTELELIVGEQLCKMLGYRIPNRECYDDEDQTKGQCQHNAPDEEETKDEHPVGWGHITCDGTVANLESIWYVPCS